MNRALRLVGISAAVAVAGFMGMLATGRPTQNPHISRNLPLPGAWERLPDREFDPNRGYSSIGFTGLDTFTDPNNAVARSSNGLVELGIQRNIARPARAEDEEVKLRVEVFTGSGTCCDKETRTRLFSWESDPFVLVGGEPINDFIPVQLPLDPGTYTVRASVRTWASMAPPHAADDAPPPPPDWVPCAARTIGLTVIGVTQ